MLPRPLPSCRNNSLMANVGVTPYPPRNNSLMANVGVTPYPPNTPLSDPDESRRG